MIDTKSGQNMPENETQEPAMPTGEQKIPSNTNQVDSGMDVSQKVTGDTVSDGLPDTATERTKREFDKLKDQFREEREQRLRLEEIFKTLTTPTPPKSPEQPVYDPQTGLINETVLSETQKAATEAKQNADQLRVEVEQYKQELESRDAYAVFPELDPASRSGKPFDKNLSVATRRILIDSTLNPQDYGLFSNQRGKGLSFKEAAKLASKSLGRKEEEVKQEAAREAIESLAPKEQAALEASSTTAKNIEPIDEQELITASRKGNINAIASRINRYRKQSKS